MEVVMLGNDSGLTSEKLRGALDFLYKGATVATSFFSSKEAEAYLEMARINKDTAFMLLPPEAQQNFIAYIKSKEGLDDKTPKSDNTPLLVGGIAAAVIAMMALKG